MAQIRLSARTRETRGKEAAKKLRKGGEVPAIFYGPEAESVMLAVKTSEFEKILKKTRGENVILGLQIESGGETDTKIVMLSELQMDPIKRSLLHADFLEISMDKEITVNVPIHLVNTPVGVTKGGILQHIRREVTVSCLPTHLVGHFDLDVSELDIGDSVHIKNIELAEGIRTHDEGHLTVAVVAAPTVAEEVAEEEEMEEELVEEEKVEKEEKISEES